MLTCSIGSTPIASRTRGPRHERSVSAYGLEGTGSARSISTSLGSRGCGRPRSTRALIGPWSHALSPPCIASARPVRSCVGFETASIQSTSIIEERLAAAWA